MSLFKEQLCPGPGGKYGRGRTRNRSRWRRWAKNQLARWLRRQGKAYREDSPTKVKFEGYE